ncbi:YihY/virulence factor BrkB family protein [Rhizobium sp. CG5]|uniref:YihY/virulence factor BrkB family protein n=1 Tax=Rhizobium sp. CG5 TaxID=2726076 RepID=UPI00203393A3|nr:YihY/virulence factor BrkB family protein [Rhizobium sp. CG5]MCM2475199.1 YihY/virulence factor BrkB family protein [Rhizobium sp. CG5]
MRAFLRMIYKVTWDALWHFTEDDGWAMASHVALSALLAIFPFLIFGTTLANFLGADQFAETAIHLIFDTWPEAIAKPLAEQVVQVLTIPRGGLLTVSVLAAAYFASNGVEALRISLNRAYRVSETRPWYLTRLLSLGFVLGAVVVFAVISALLVAVPLALNFAELWFPLLKDALATISNWRIYGTLGLLAIGLIASHLSLPAGRRRIMDVIPGVILTLLLWLIGALIFASYLATFANYAATYAGLASVMVVLVFLYMIGAIFIIGAEFNAALLKFEVLGGMHSVKTPVEVSKADKPADIQG